MSDKNVPTGQWSKSLSPSASTMLHGAVQKEHHVAAQLSGDGRIADPTSLSLTQTPLMTSPKIMCDNSSKQQSERVAYAAARFQTPSIVNYNVTLTSLSPSTLSLSSVASASQLVVGGATGAVTPAHSITSNVPVSGSFLAPTFPLTPTMLNINSYAAAESPAIVGVQQKQQQQQQQLQSPLTAAILPCDVAPLFGVGQLNLQNLNAQQKYDLNKLMATSNFPTVHLPIPCNSPNSGAVSITTSAIAPTTTSSSSFTSLSAHRQQQPQQQHGTHQEQQQSPLGTIPSQIAEQLVQTISSSSNPGNNTNKIPPSIPLYGKLTGLGVRTLDEDKLKSIQHVVESAVGEHARQEIVQILDRISNLRPVEKLLLYLRLPGEMPETDPLRQPQNPLGTRSEINHTINWVRTHLEQDPQVSIPKQDVYNDYLLYCERLDIKPLSTADFGKVMKQVFPGIRPRRLGTRGHSRYCYAAMRKTSKLPAPHLPTIQTNEHLLLEAEKNVMEEHNSRNENNNNQSNNNVTDNEMYWPIIKQWAENILHVKIESINDLANHVKKHVPSVSSTSQFIDAPNVAISTAAAITTTTTPQKKYQQRDTKEKRILVDLGPLKKRPKKKRKGSSSSSESGSNNQQQQSQRQQQQQPLSSPSSVPNILRDDGQTTTKMIKIKQEIVDTPTIYPQALTRQQSIVEDRNAIPTVLEQQQQSEMKPMNLVSESRDAAIAISTSRAVQRQEQQQQQLQQQQHSSASAFEHVHQSGSRHTTSPKIGVGCDGGPAAVKNLTPKILEISTSSIVAASAQIERETVNILPAHVTIKEEVMIDDYSTANIFCKKVLKAQQTKGFWINSPKSCSISTSGNNTLTTSSTVVTAPSSTCMNLPIITTTVCTPPPLGAGVITTPPPSNTAAISNFCMGPPSTQLVSISSSSFATNTAITSSPNSLNMSFNQLDDSAPAPAPVPTTAHGKVLSRNFQQLRAKKLMAAATAMASATDSSDLSVVKDADLPENLGLPRERVISICNMDKHELDDYFLPVEEENSEDQETELLQYFQMGDAEEKTHSTKNASSNRNDGRKSITTTIAYNNDINDNGNPTVVTEATIPNDSITNVPLTLNVMMTLNNNAITTNRNNKNNSIHIPTAAPTIKAATIKNNNSNCSNMLQAHAAAYNDLNTQLSTSSLSSSSSLPTVGLASASLIQLTQKHHQQKQLQHHQACVKEYITTTETEKATSTTIITSTSPSSSALKRKVNVNASTATQDITAARRNYSFLPISPNINTTPPNSASSSTLCCSHNFNNNDSFFASPNIASRTLIKQHSMDCDSSDPMIGSGRRKRSYFNVTSASAPPSPSVMKQQQQQQRRQECKAVLMDPISWIPEGIHNNRNNNNNGSYNNGNVTLSSLTPNGNSTLSTSMLNDQNSLDLDLFGETVAATANGTTIPTPMANTCCNHALNITVNDVFATLNEVTQRSQSVPLSQLRRSHSPNFKKCFQMETGLEPGPIGNSGATTNTSCAYSACASQSQTPVPADFGDSTTILSENSYSQQSATIKLEEVGGVVASDTTVILDEVDVSEILSSPDFVMKFSNLNKSNTAITTCSSTGSSSGYSSNGSGNSGGVGNFTSTTNNCRNGVGGYEDTGGCSNLGGMLAAISRSVPSTPLPHHNHHYRHHHRIHDHSHYTFHNCKRYGDGNYLTCNRNGENHFDCITAMMENHHRIINSDYKMCRDNIGSTCDISKSMPATPITTTPCSNSFRYSPTDITNDFLINGNTIEENMNSSLNAGNASATSVPNGCTDNDLLDTEHLMINSDIMRDDDNNHEFINNDNREQNNKNFNNLVTAFSATQSTVNEDGSSLMNDSSVVVVGMQSMTSVDILDNL